MEKPKDKLKRNNIQYNLFDMAEAPLIKDTLAFMQWFESGHPDLYHQHWQSVLVASKGTSIAVNGTNIDIETKNMLTDLLLYYYTHIQSSNYLHKFSF